MLKKLEKFVSEKPFVTKGAVIGAVYGTGISALNVMEGCLQLAFFPVHMTIRTTQAVCEPFVRIASPVVIMPIFTAIGAGIGLACDAAVDSSASERLDTLEEELEADREAAEDRDRRLDEIFAKAARGGYADL